MSDTDRELRDLRDDIDALRRAIRKLDAELTQLKTKVRRLE